MFTNFEEKLTNLVKLSAPEPIDIYCLWVEQHESFLENEVLLLKNEGHRLSML